MAVGALTSEPSIPESQVTARRALPMVEQIETEPTQPEEPPVAPDPAVSAVAEPLEEPDPPVTAEPEPAPAQKAAPASTKGVVVIDAGHQKKADLSLEPIGPGASERKPKVQGGASGVATKNAESAVNLEVAKRLRDELEARGVRVIMVRERQDVNVANSKRAKIANEADADLFIRLHCDGSGGGSTRGLSTLVPGKNRWTGPILSESMKAGRIVHKAVIRSTGAKDRGVISRSDLSGFNWSEVPTVLVEMGFMSNPDEDRKLDSDEYQDKLAEGMADGIVDYLER